jgi:hypothetical protein
MTGITNFHGGRVRLIAPVAGARVGRISAPVSGGLFY